MRDEAMCPKCGAAPGARHKDDCGIHTSYFPRPQIRFQLDLLRIRSAGTDSNDRRVASSADQSLRRIEGHVRAPASLVLKSARTRIGGAALDVFEVDPLPMDSPLRNMDNCLLAPHNANSSPRAARRVHENTIRNLLRGLRDEP